MVETPAFCTHCFAIGSRVAYQSIDPKFRDCWAVELPTVALVNGSYSDTSYLYSWLHPFYITKARTTNNKGGEYTDCQRCYYYWCRSCYREGVRWLWTFDRQCDCSDRVGGCTCEAQRSRTTADFYLKGFIERYKHTAVSGTGVPILLP